MYLRPVGESHEDLSLDHNPPLGVMRVRGDDRLGPVLRELDEQYLGPAVVVHKHVGFLKVGSREPPDRFGEGHGVRTETFWTTPRVEGGSPRDVGSKIG